jgi:hypothetical protein
MPLAWSVSLISSSSVRTYCTELATNEVLKKKWLTFSCVVFFVFGLEGALSAFSVDAVLPAGSLRGPRGGCCFGDAAFPDDGSSLHDVTSRSSFFGCIDN